MRRLFASPLLRYPLTGILLGVGAPIGTFAFRYLLDERVRWSPVQEIERHSFFYVYNLIGTCLIFALAGLIAGHRAERLRKAEAFYHDLADHDVLTGLFNARVLRERYSRALERATRYRAPVSLLLIDVDLLKQLNDQHGHAAGDAALIHVGDVLQQAKRAEDTAARWGGDEFAVLLEGGDERAARRVAETILDRLQASPVQSGDDRLVVTVSIGISSGIPREGREDFFAAADGALYEAKRAGRNRVLVAQ